VESSLYIVGEGQVRVHDGARTLATLGEGELLGELELLDAAPRPTAVTAVADTQLFRLDSEPFYEVVGDYAELAQALLQMLARRLRRAGESKADQARSDLLGGLSERLAQRS
jgi:CRP-like cAMP-binding protein